VGRRLRWIIFLPVATLAWFAPASAEPLEGLNAVGYIIPDTEEPQRVDDLYEVCGSEVENNINRNFEGEPFQDCPTDFFMLHYSGFITFPEAEQIQLMVAADDGGIMQIGDVEFGTWDLKGCQWSEIVTVTPEAGSYPLDGWFYEWGGGTCFMLAWRIGDGYWEIVPDEVFTRDPVSVTPVTSTTVLEQATTTTEESTTTTEETTTTTTSTTTTSTTTTTTTQAPPPQTTTAPVPPTTAVPVPPTTEAPLDTTTVPEATSTLPPAPTSLPALPTTVPPRTTVPETTLPPTTAQTTTTTQAQPTTTAPTPTSLPTTTVPPAQAIAEASPQQIASAIADIPPEQASQVFAALDVSSLDEEQQEALIEAVQAAPTEVRAAFEDQVDIFKEGLDDYVPVGSNIPVGERRVLVAIGAAITAAGAATRMRR